MLQSVGILETITALTFITEALFRFRHSVVSNSLWLHELQHTRPSCPSPTAWVHPNPCPIWWCHPTISTFDVPFSSYPQSFPESGSFQMSQLFASGGQSIGVSASTSVLPINIQGWFSLGWTGSMSVQSKGLSSLLQLHGSKASFFWWSAFFIVKLYIHTWPLEKP